ncbi:protein of unknown function [Candidatus Methylomirabilis oxygeniifera]|uniref:Uncharacterized protein n=1 Tax=Methylomirabilis oxygeniifera TaxID=671143 RepID=D5ML82_METO1|nr:protein of unknown function [Candidatus Methylomirabilis oxyfera]
MPLMTCTLNPRPYFYSHSMVLGGLEEMS